MLLYWGIFTLGFFFGSILAFVVFAPKKPEDDAEYESQPINPPAVLSPLQDAQNNKRLFALVVPQSKSKKPTKLSKPWYQESEKAKISA